MNHIFVQLLLCLSVQDSRTDFITLTRLKPNISRSLPAYLQEVYRHPHHDEHEANGLAKIKFASERWVISCSNKCNMSLSHTTYFHLMPYHHGHSIRRIAHALREGFAT